MCRQHSRPARKRCHIRRRKGRKWQVSQAFQPAERVTNELVALCRCQDDIQGNIGDDVMYGQAGKDSMSGGSGKDTIFGGAGVDILEGDQGADVVFGCNDKVALTDDDTLINCS